MPAASPPSRDVTAERRGLYTADEAKGIVPGRIVAGWALGSLAGWAAVVLPLAGWLR